MLCSCGEYGMSVALSVREIVRSHVLVDSIDMNSLLSLLPQAIASVIISNTRGDTSLNDQCAWYGMCYLVDTTLGLVLAVWGLRIIDGLAQKWNWDALKQSGVYEGVDGLLHWFWQVFAWLVNLTVGKVIIYYFMVLCSQPLAVVGGILFAPLQGNIRFELLFVMIFFPGFLNVIYFWIADSHLQAKGENTGAHEVDPEEAEMTQQRKEALLPDGAGEDEPPAATTTLV
jgi:STIMATE family